MSAEKHPAATAQAARQSWADWIASQCPRLPPEEPTQKVRLLNNLKPYTPSIPD